MAPMVHGLEAKYFGRIKFTYLDADDIGTEVFRRALGFRYQPEFYFLDGAGQVLMKLVGYVQESTFEAMFAQYLP